MSLEAVFASEAEVEEAIATDCERIMELNDIKGVVLRRFGLDIAIATSRWLKMIEVKAYAHRHGRCGFGGSGGGNQVKVLDHQPPELLIWDQHVRWVICKRDLPARSPRFSLFSCTQAAESAMRGVEPGKHNNFALSRLSWVDEGGLSQQLEAFLLS